MIVSNLHLFKFYYQEIKAFSLESTPSKWRNLITKHFQHLARCSGDLFSLYIFQTASKCSNRRWWSWTTDWPDMFAPNVESSTKSLARFVAIWRNAGKVRSVRSVRRSWPSGETCRNTWNATGGMDWWSFTTLSTVSPCWTRLSELLPEWEIVFNHDNFDFQQNTLSLKHGTDERYS